MKNLPARKLPFAICLVVVTASVVIPTSAVAAPSVQSTTGFFSSFEPSDPQPDWVNTSEVDADGNKKTSGVTGSPVTGIPGNITDRIVEVQANGENPPNELAANVFDGNVNTKWLVFQPTGWVWGKLDEPVAVVHYALTSANDAPERDPRDWTLEGSQDGQTWTVLDTQTDQLFDTRFQTKDYRFENARPFLYYRLNITRNRSGGATTIVQLAELQLSDGDTTPPPPTDMKAFVTGGPVNGFNHRPNVGFTGVQSLQYSGGQIAEERGYAYNKVFDVDVLVTPTSELSYLVFPELTANDLDYPSTYAAVDLAFSDGTYLSDLGARDQHDAELSPQGQGESKTLYTDQWNYKVARIGEVAAGKTVDRILVAYDSPTGVGLFNGWVDDIRIVGSPVHDTPDRLSDHVDTRRGTHSSGGYSRGNNIPAAAVPHGFNFWVPMTNAGSTSWLYEYHRQNNAQNLPMLQAFSVSHEPSPWMGDRQTFQVMPSASAATPPDGNRSSRALPFRHQNEVAKPHYYGVTFENGIETEVAPSDHAAMLRFTFTGDMSTLIFDNVNNQANLNVDAAADGVITGFSDVRSGLSTGATRMYMYATFDTPITASGRPSGVGNRTAAAGWARFDTSGDKVVTMRVATSLISVAQARHNLELEIAPSDTFEDVTERAQQAWDDKLSVIEVEGASTDQLTTLYSNLYRLFLYPNSAFENTGTNDDPVYKHAVQSSTTTPASGPTQTGAPVVDGKVYVNNGFWDTYRTTWPAYALLTPSMAGEMVDGFVQQYKDGGWISRWSSPGYANLMVGTSSDVAFADAYLKDVTDFDVAAAYDAAIKNATVNPPNQNVGRKGFTTSPFLGYTSVQSTDEAMSWALDGYINDFGIANMAKALHEQTGEPSYLEDYEYFINRAQNYVNMFDPNVGFFQGRNADGSWRVPPDSFDPRVWGFDFTETNAWNMAFHVPQDGRGLANLYGGTGALADKLDEFFSTPETAAFPGSYGGIIHEMREARDVRMGQYGHSNQPSHHIVYMYDYAGQPWKTQEKAREALSRLYLGSEIGQGYPGDEDNGEMSAWQVFGALGFYPLQMGSPYYAIGSPLFDKATVHLENGKDIVINAPHNSRDNVYIQGLRVNGDEYDKTYLPHDLLAEGAVLDFTMGPAPSQWGTTEDAAPPSITDDADVPRPLQDATGAGQGVATASGKTNVAGLFDNTSDTRASLAGDGPWVQYRFRDDERQLVRFYTLTSGEEDAADPSGWVLKGSNDGRSWTVLDQRSGEDFSWRMQTRPFKLARPSNYSVYRIEFTDSGGSASTRLAEVELLTSNKPLTSPLSAEVDGAVAWPGDTVPVRVTVSNSGDAPASGEVAVTVPEEWSVEPATASFGPIAGGGSETMSFDVTVPESTEPGGYTIEASITSRRGPATAIGDVQVIGNVIEFTPGTQAEVPWLFDADASQLDGAVFDGHARFTDGERYVVYRFQLPSAVTGGTLTLDIGNQFLVKVSTDGAGWRTVLEETRNIRDLSNRQERALDLNELRGDGRDLYVWIGDSQTEDGWGAWLARLKLEMLSSTTNSLGR